MTLSNVTRRSALAGGAIAAVAGVARHAHAQVAAKTFVLVHGAAGGGWQWRRVADRLEREGCKVFTPTLTGLGERSHLLSKNVGLNTHVADVVNVVRWEGLERICLVAHSYAGWPCGAALDQIGAKVASVVWLDAFKPEDGRALIDLAAASLRPTYEEAVADGALGMPLAARLSTAAVNARDEAFLRAKLTPQPIATYLQTLRYGGGLERIAKKTYVRLADFANPSFDRAYAACKADKAWSTAELTDCGHYAMFDAPERLATLLLNAA